MTPLMQPCATTFRTRVQRKTTGAAPSSPIMMLGVIIQLVEKRHDQENIDAEHVLRNTLPKKLI